MDNINRKNVISFIKCWWLICTKHVTHHTNTESSITKHNQAGRLFRFDRLLCVINWNWRENEQRFEQFSKVKWNGFTLSLSLSYTLAIHLNRLERFMSLKSISSSFNYRSQFVPFCNPFFPSIFFFSSVVWNWSTGKSRSRNKNSNSE